MPLTGHEANTVLPVGVDTQTVETSEGDLATERDTDTERDLVGKKPAVLDGDRDELTVRDTRDALADRDGETLKPVVGDTDGDRDGVTSVHCA